jgi:hypothetical protein
MSEKEPVHDVNIRGSSYFVATTMARCWHCNASTRVIALTLPSGHEILGEAGSELAEEWDKVSGDAFLFYVEWLPRPISERLAALAPFFHLSASPVTLNSYWGSHCEGCGTLLEDHELHCEPGGPFAPSNEAAASRIHLRQVHERFEAASAGYSPCPEFASSMCRS